MQDYILKSVLLKSKDKSRMFQMTPCPWHINCLSKSFYLHVLCVRYRTTERLHKESHKEFSLLEFLCMTIESLMKDT